MEQEFRYDLFDQEQFSKQPQTVRMQRKGHSIVSPPDSYAVLGMLTTGENPELDFLLEISIDIYNNGKKESSYTQLVKPESYYLVSKDEMESKEDYCIVDGGPVYYIDKKMVQRTGITNQMLCQAREQQEVLEDVCKLLANHVIVGYGISAQIDFLNGLLTKQGSMPLENEYMDCQAVANRLGKGTEHATLNELAIVYELPYEGPERADKMSALIQNIYKQLHPERISIENKVCVFTGTLQNMVRGQAMQLVRSCGGIVGTSVTKRTDYLVLGSKEYQARLRGEKSTKLRKAERMIQEGLSINIISEEVFYQMVGYRA